ncbi:glycosyltransferase family 2 protein [Pseudoalteromonas sp. T1lg48]|uniref:glycosyltransferase family 2 protein n=1 Tax=Pseudoalteromonas sp. T1lg48 TaxID=2077100 RepID=UPI000CF65E0D|nr:glycosyltransferase family 2 protein [Pseudoalteromonas sp. T1lg48]
MEKVSIVMPCYNASRSLNRAIDSVLNQTYSEWELLIVDDCSTDDSMELAQSHGDKRIRVFSNVENSGAGVSRNKAISEATGRFIAFLDTDDYWHKDKLLTQVNFMLNNGYALTYHAYQKFNEKGMKGVFSPPSSASYKQLLQTNYIGCLTAMYDSQQLGKCYMPTIRKRQDYALWLAILKTGVVARGLPEVLAYYSTDTGMTQNKAKIIKHQWLFYREHLKLGYLTSLSLLFSYATHGLIKYLR